MRRAVKGYLGSPTRDLTSAAIELGLIMPHTSLALSSARKADAAFLERGGLVQH